MVVRVLLEEIRTFAPAGSTGYALLAVDGDLHFDSPPRQKAKIVPRV
jgi:hypothetical protein